MRTYLMHEARAALSKLVERALEGEPQRITRYGKDAVVVVSEADWSKSAPSMTLADLFLRHVSEAEDASFLDADALVARHDRPIGSDFLDEA